MKYPRYPKYKDSGVEWLGEVPEHWAVSRLKWSVMFQRGHDLSSEQREEGPFPVVTSSGKSATHNEAKAHGPAIVTGRYGTIGKFYFIEGDYWPLNTTLYSIDLHRNQCRFIWYMLQPLTPLFQIEAGKSAVPGIDRNDIHQFPVALPHSSVEQVAIASFLDRETSRVDRLIEKKRALIELLGEKRQALISRCVTRGLPPEAARADGLDPHPTMKDSGIEWVGEVPEHWEVVRLKRIVNMRSGDNITSQSIEPQGECPVYGGNGIRGYTDAYTHDGEFALLGRQGAWCGNVHIACGTFWASEHAVVISTRGGGDIQWVAELLRSMDLRRHSQTAAQPGLSVEFVENLLVPNPPPTEQRVIARMLEQETDQIDKLVVKTHATIDVLQEYRVALITAAVTGKIDVREVNA